MPLVGKLVAFGLRQALDVAADDVVEAVERRLADPSRALPRALARANERTWQGLGVALGGDGLLDRVKALLSPGEDRALREQVSLFLQTTAASLGEMTDDF